MLIARFHKNESHPFTLKFSHNMQYNSIWEKNKIKSNISLYDKSIIFLAKIMLIYFECLLSGTISLPFDVLNLEVNILNWYVKERLTGFSKLCACDPDEQAVWLSTHAWSQLLSMSNVHPFPKCAWSIAPKHSNHDRTQIYHKIALTSCHIVIWMSFF